MPYGYVEFYRDNYVFEFHRDMHGTCRYILALSTCQQRGLYLLETPSVGASGSAVTCIICKMPMAQLGNTTTKLADAHITPIYLLHNPYITL